MGGQILGAWSEKNAVLLPVFYWVLRVHLTITHASQQEGVLNFV